MDNGIGVSVVLPCLNEEEALGICIDKIKEVFLKERIKGEIIVVDNGSTDRSRKIAEEKGVKIVFEPKRGYGAAYLRGLKEAKGTYIIVGDSDNTYDFYDIPKFLKPLKEEGYDFVIGTRLKGKILKGAMPWLHRYIGNPIFSQIFRIFFRSSLSDILCGMRAFTQRAYRIMRLRTLGMEFAMEMVLAAGENRLKIKEVPIVYYPRKGKSKLNSFPDGWRYLRFMLLYCPLWLYFIPGITGFLLGLFILLLLLKGPIVLFGRFWYLHPMIFASALCILSYQIINLGIYAHIYAIRQGFLRYDRLMHFLRRYFKLERGLLLGTFLFLLGFLINLFIIIEWVSKSFGALYRNREAIFSTTLMILGLQTIFSSFFISLLFLKKK